MTALIQVGGHGHSFLVDPYPLYEPIREELSLILENPSILKIMFGCDNDISYINRDFDTNLVGVIDVQFLHWEMMKTLNRTLSNNSQAIIPIYNRFGNWLNRVLGFNFNPVSNNISDLEKFRNSCNNRISLTNLTKIYFPELVLPQSNATLADWRIRPLEHPGMISYALADVHILLRIWQRAKKLVIRNFSFKWKKFTN